MYLVKIMKHSDSVDEVVEVLERPFETYIAADYYRTITAKALNVNPNYMVVIEGKVDD